MIARRERPDQQKTGKIGGRRPDGRGRLGAMIGLLTWTTYGTWLSGPARGWIDLGRSAQADALPEPDEVISQQRRRSLNIGAKRR